MHISGLYASLLVVQKVKVQCHSRQRRTLKDLSVSSQMKKNVYVSLRVILLLSVAKAAWQPILISDGQFDR